MLRPATRLLLPDSGAAPPEPPPEPEPDPPEPGVEPPLNAEVVVVVAVVKSFPVAEPSAGPESVKVSVAVAVAPRSKLPVAVSLSVNAPSSVTLVRSAVLEGVGVTAVSPTSAQHPFPAQVSGVCVSYYRNLQWIALIAYSRPRSTLHPEMAGSK